MQQQKVIKIIDDPATRGYSSRKLVSLEVENTNEGAYATIRGLDKIIMVRDLCDEIIEHQLSLAEDIDDEDWPKEYDDYEGCVEIPDHLINGFSRGDQIAYVPNHIIRSDIAYQDHPDTDYGFVWQDEGNTVLCHFWKKNSPVIRTRANVERCKKEDLKHHISREVDFVWHCIRSINRSMAKP